MATNFAEAFDITYLGEGGLTLCHTTSWGMSTRVIGGVVLTHGDDTGLVLPPRLAPHQVVVVPIGRGEALDRVEQAAADLAERLRRSGVRTHVDTRPQVSPGFKFNDWELKGVPVRVELGPRDLEAGSAVLARRLGDQGKETVPLDALPERIPSILDEFQTFLLARATRFRDQHTITVDDWTPFADAVSTGWARAFHCGTAACEDEIKARTAATPRCVPIDGTAESGTCIRCGATSAYGKRVIFGRAY